MHSFEYNKKFLVRARKVSMCRIYIQCRVGVGVLLVVRTPNPNNFLRLQKEKERALTHSLSLSFTYLTSHHSFLFSYVSTHQAFNFNSRACNFLTYLSFIFLFFSMSKIDPSSPSLCFCTIPSPPGVK